MSDTRFMHVGDLWPPLSYEVYYEDLKLDITTAITGATPVAFTITNKATGVVLVNARAGAVVVGNKLVQATMDWLSGDTAVAGAFDVKIVFTVGGKPATAPSGTAKQLVISA